MKTRAVNERRSSATQPPTPTTYNYAPREGRERQQRGRSPKMKAYDVVEAAGEGRTWTRMHAYRWVVEVRACERS